MAGMMEIRSRRDMTQLGRPDDTRRYAPLLCALTVYKSGAARAAKKYKELAADLTFNLDMEVIRRKRGGSIAAAAGAGMAAVGGIVGLLAISTLAPVAMLVGGVAGAAGGVISVLAGHQATQNRKRVLAEVNTIVQELEVKVTAVTREIQQLVGCCEEEDNVKVLTNEKRGGLTKISFDRSPFNRNRVR